MTQFHVNARCLYDLGVAARVRGSLEQESEFLSLAYLIAERSGYTDFFTPHDGTIPPLLRHTPLGQHWLNGWRVADECAHQLHECWEGWWTLSVDGSHGTRPVVAKSPKGFFPGFMICERVGYCESSYGDAVPTLQAAKDRSIALELQWHRMQSNSIASVLSQQVCPHK